MRRRREAVEHPSGTITACMGATHFLTKTLPRATGEMAYTFSPGQSRSLYHNPPICPTALTAHRILR